MNVTLLSLDDTQHRGPLTEADIVFASVLCSLGCVLVCAHTNLICCGTCLCARCSLVCVCALS